MRSILLLAVVGGCTVRDHYSYPPDASGDATTNGDGGGGVDAIDVDGDPAQAQFDLGFVNQWRMSTMGQTNESFAQWVRVVNTGVLPLDLSTATITAVTDSNVTFFDEVVTWGLDADFTLSPGMAAGALSVSSDAYMHVYQSGVMTEPTQDESVGLLDMLVDNFPTGSWTFVIVDITVQIENASASISVTIDNAGILGEPDPEAEQGQRVSSSPL